MKIELIILGAILITIFFLLFQKNESKYVDVKIENQTVHSEVADTWPKRIRGLMFRKNLPENQGMLFIFDDEQKYGFWMMNTSIPLDIIWIGSDKKVVDFIQNAQPCMISCHIYSPKKEARYVLEVNSGFVEKNGIKIGQKIDFKE